MVSYVCHEDRVVDMILMDNLDEFDIEAAFFKGWWSCSKRNYNKMIDIIRNNKELRDISTINNGANGGFGVLTEFEVAISAGIFCLDKGNHLQEQIGGDSFQQEQIDGDLFQRDE
jgi:hypothetical protein